MTKGVKHVKRVNIGSVSCATMREEDLIPAFVAELESQRPLRRTHRTLARDINARMEQDGYYEDGDGLQALQKKHGYRLTARIATNGREVHKYAMSVDAELPHGNMLSENDDDALLELLRDFADWIYKGLCDEWDYRMSDEQVDDSIRANEYDFREDGQRDD